MEPQEYLLGYGLSGEFGRFRAPRPVPCRRVDRAVVQTWRGLEIGRVLREAEPGHAPFLPNTTVGTLLRLALPEDDRLEQEQRRQAQTIFEHGRRLAGDMGLPLELLDVEVLLDGRHAFLHHLRWADCDPRPLVSALSRTYDLHVALADLSVREVNLPEDAGEDHEGCGRPGCGSGEGGCGSCGPGGCTTCHVQTPRDANTAYFLGLRDQMERKRVPLL